MKTMQSLYVKALPFAEMRKVVHSDFHYSPHFHEGFSIGAVQEAEVSYVHKEGETRLRVGELSIMNPYEMHSCNPIENEARSYYMLYVDSSWCKALQESLFGALEAFIPLPLVHVKEKEFYNKYLHLAQILLDKTTFTLEKEESLSAFLSALFLRYCDKNALILKENDAKYEAILKAQAYLKEQACANPDLETLAKCAGFSRFHFLRLFKSYTHMTPHAFLLSQKIEHAKKLLKEEKGLAEVALEVGFLTKVTLAGFLKALWL